MGHLAFSDLNKVIIKQISQMCYHSRFVMQKWKINTSFFKRWGTG